jgi:tripartite-type tricarboxylate transporter receptor subunit TctC
MKKSKSVHLAFVSKNRRKLTAALVVSALTPLPGGAQTPASFPTKPIRIVVPFPPGGYADATSRLLAMALAPGYGQPITVDNRAGAGGNIGAELVARATPDGHTLLMGSIATNAINIHLYPKLAFDPQKSFEPVAFIADAETVLVVHPSLSAQTVADLIRIAEAKPGSLSYASAGSGSTGHLAGELFEFRTNTHIVHIPYRGNAPALNDLVAGQIPMSFATLQTALPFIQTGKLRALAVLSASRSSLLPGIPTLAESGVKGVEVRNWIGLFAPLGTAQAVLQKLNDDVNGVMRKSETQERLSKLALTHIEMTPRSFSEFVNIESQRWGAVIKSVGIKAD